MEFIRNHQAGLNKFHIQDKNKLPYILLGSKEAHNYSGVIL